jgi:crotonobetainyl-CoA:carnitine CoA-transferase CaiB-like acyl-CoA transferase
MTKPLDGLKVVDLTRQMVGPYGTVVLADYGADVIKVESVPHGDPSRYLKNKENSIGGENSMYLLWNRGKRSIAVDLRQPEGIQLVKRLCEQADVFVENYRPGVADSMGLDYATLSALNPRLIYCSVSAFGRTGPLATFPGTDPVIQAMSGAMYLTGERGGGPVLIGIPVADFTGAMLLVQGVLLAMAAREKTGQGQYVEISMLTALMSALTTRLAAYFASGKDPQRSGHAHSVTAPYQVYETADGHVVAGAWAEDSWPRFCRAVGLPELIDDPRFRTNGDRIENLDQLNSILEPLFRTKNSAAWEDAFHAENALFGEVCSIDRILHHPHIQQAGVLQSISHPTAGQIPVLAPPIQLSDTPGSVDRHPPLYGEHSTEVLRDFGYSDDEIEALAAQGVVRQRQTPAAASASAGS